jgi:hypothetical protein
MQLAEIRTAGTNKFESIPATHLLPPHWSPDCAYRRDSYPLAASRKIVLLAKANNRVLPGPRCPSQEMAHRTEHSSVRLGSTWFDRVEHRISVR